MMLSKIYLCSTSPRRRELLNQIGVPFEVIPITVDETNIENQSARDHIQSISYQKALVGFKHPDRKEKIPVLAADTLVLFNEQIIGKPDNKEEFLLIMKKLANNLHTVLTAVTVMNENFNETIMVETQVTFRNILLDELEFYWEKYHPIDKAGGYGIQDFAAVFIKNIQGSYSNVVGLPLYETYQLLRKMENLS